MCGLILKTGKTQLLLKQICLVHSTSKKELGQISVETGKRGGGIKPFVNIKFQVEKIKPI